MSPEKVTQEYYQLWQKSKELPLYSGAKKPKEDYLRCVGPYYLYSSFKVFNLENPPLFGYCPPFLTLPSLAKETQELLKKYGFTNAYEVDFEEAQKLREKNNFFIDRLKVVQTTQEQNLESFDESQTFGHSQTSILSSNHQLKNYLLKINENSFLFLTNGNYNLTQAPANLLYYFFQSNLLQEPSRVTQLEKLYQSSLSSNIHYNGRFIFIEGNISNRLIQKGILSQYSLQLNKTILSLPLCLTHNEVEYILCQITERF